ncbi:MAG: hypothetical protein FWC93_03310 [Defluviitaleaceae bacterium]|nr:hypothetical protein [Defluviitaleaceae bacterium]
MATLLDMATTRISGETPHLQRVISDFIAAVGVSYLPLHKEAAKVAIGLPAAKAIQTAADKGRLGFKRRAVRC